MPPPLSSATTPLCELLDAPTQVPRIVFQSPHLLIVDQHATLPQLSTEQGPDNHRCPDQFVSASDESAQPWRPLWHMPPHTGGLMACTRPNPDRNPSSPSRLLVTLVAGLYATSVSSDHRRLPRPPTAYRVLASQDNRQLVTLTVPITELKATVRWLRSLPAPQLTDDQPRYTQLLPRPMLHVAQVAWQGATPPEQERIVSKTPWFMRAWLRGGEQWNVDHIPDDTLQEAIHEALRRRMRLPKHLCGNQRALRLIHGEGDGLRGLDIEWHAGYLALWIGQQVSQKRRDQIVTITQRLDAKGLYVKTRAKNAPNIGPEGLKQLYELHARTGQDAPDSLFVEEGGLRYKVWLSDGVQTGLFLDQRGNRAWIRKISKAKSVLNLFSYTCSFSVAAAASGAKTTVSVDVSKKSLERGRSNFEANHLPLTDHRFFPDDALTWIARASRRQETFDIIILDPPSYGTSGKKRFVLQQHFPQLIEAAFHLLSPRGGALLVSTNHRGVTSGRLISWIEQAASRSNRTVENKQLVTPEPDFPFFAAIGPHMKSCRVTVGGRASRTIKHPSKPHSKRRGAKKSRPHRTR